VSRTFPNAKAITEADLAAVNSYGDLDKVFLRLIANGMVCERIQSSRIPKPCCRSSRNRGFQQAIWTLHDIDLERIATGNVIASAGNLYQTAPAVVPSVSQAFPGCSHKALRPLSRENAWAMPFRRICLRHDRGQLRGRKARHLYRFSFRLRQRGNKSVP